MSPADNGKFVDQVKTFMNTSTYKDIYYKGLGHVELIATITDQDAIQKILDKRYLTVSIGGGSDHAYCSICGTDKKVEACDHYRGEVHDGQLCFYISGLMDFDHVSYVASPADDNAVSQVMDATDDLKLEILDYELEDKGTKNMKLTLAQIKKKLEDNGFLDYVKGLGLPVADNYEQLLKDAKDIAFLFSEDRLMPMVDAATAIATRSALEELEDTDASKESMIEVADKAIESFLGEKLSLADAIAKIKPTEESATKQQQAPVVAPVAISDEAMSKIAATVVEGLKAVFTVSDSFSAQRMRTLEKEVAALNKELSSLEDKYKNNIVLQIAQLEDNIGNTEYTSKLNGRSLVSLEDKLQDLLDSVAKEKKDDYNEQNQDDKQGLDSASLNDANSSESNESNSEGEQSADTNINDSQDDSSSATELSVAEIKDEYSTLIKTKGFKAASAYLNKLRDENKLPSNFTFNN
jgi:galactokinase